MGGYLSNEADTRRAALPEKTLFARDVRIALYQFERNTLRALLCAAGVEGFKAVLPPVEIEKLRRKYIGKKKGSSTDAALEEPLFSLRNVSKEMYLELVEKRWSREYFAPFFVVIKPTTEMTVATLTCCILRNQYAGIDFILERLAELHPATKGDSNFLPAAKDGIPCIRNAGMKLDSNSSQQGRNRVSFSFIAAQRLAHLFPIVCQQGDLENILRFIEFGLFDPSDPAPFRIVAHNAIRHYCSVMSRVGAKIWPTSASENAAESRDASADVAAGAPIPATSSSSTQPTEPVQDGYHNLTTDQLQSMFVDPDTGFFKKNLIAAEEEEAHIPPQSRKESLAYLAPLLTIMSTHKFPGIEVIDGIIAAAVNRARLRRKAGYATRQEMIDHARVHFATVTQPELDAKEANADEQQQADGYCPLDESQRNFEFIPPVAAIMAVYKGGYSPDTHNVHSPELRAKVRAAVSALMTIGVSEEATVSVVSMLGEE